MFIKMQNFYLVFVCKIIKLLLFLKHSITFSFIVYLVYRYLFIIMFVYMSMYMETDTTIPLIFCLHGKITLQYI